MGTIRDRLVQIRVGRRERRVWREAAAAERLTVSDLIRDAMRLRLARARATEVGAADADRDVQRAG